MAIWLNRAGGHGEFEQNFLQQSRIYATWDGLDRNLSKISKREATFKLLEEVYPDAKPRRLHNRVSQIWPFVHEMKKGDLTILPLKTQPSIYIGEITGDYRFESTKTRAPLLCLAINYRQIRFQVEDKESQCARGGGLSHNSKKTLKWRRGRDSNPR